MVSIQFDAKVRVFQSDNGGQYLSRGFTSFFNEFGIIHQTTYPGTPEQNGIAERKTCNFLEITRALMFTMNVPKTFWSEAVQTVAFLMNRITSRVLKFKTPLELILPSSTLFPLPPKTFG